MKRSARVAGDRRKRLLRRGRRGFTLVELLMVIAIIALLAALLLPTLSKVRERGRQMQSVGNISAIAKGIIMFSQDNRNYLPGFPGGPSFNAADLADKKNNVDEKDSVWDYVKDERVYESPSDRGTTWGPMAAANCFEQHGTSYAYPVVGGRGIESIPQATKSKYKTTMIESSSKKIIVFEPPLATSQAKNGSKRDHWYTSKQGAVAGFMDGHAEMVMTNMPNVDMEDHPYY